MSLILRRQHVYQEREVRPLAIPKTPRGEQLRSSRVCTILARQRCLRITGQSTQERVEPTVVVRTPRINEPSWIDDLRHQLEARSDVATIAVRNEVDRLSRRVLGPGMHIVHAASDQ